ncbi:MAG TPA: hypothetical protein VGF13_20450 [Verrucomicrobiae bacterium]
MKTSSRKPKAPDTRRAAAAPRDGAGRKLISQVDLLRIRVTAAASAWKRAKEQASQAKRRRKLAKLLAKRAKKDARTAKNNLDELREALAAAQTRAENPWRTAAPRFSQTKPKRAASKTKPRHRAIRESTALAPAEGTDEKQLNNSGGPASPPETISGELPATT